MPVLNSLGNALMGVGDGPASIDRIKIADVGGGGQWLNDLTALYQTRKNGTYLLETYSFQTGSKEPFAHRGANHLVAGGGRFAAWLNGYGMYGDLTDPEAYPLAASRDGAIAYIPHYHVGLGFRVVASDDSTTLVVPGVDCKDLQLHSATQASWRDNSGKLFTIGIPEPTVLGPLTRPRRAVSPTGEVWWVYWAGDNIGLVAHPENSFQGYLIESQPLAFNHDAIFVERFLRVVYSKRQGELPDDLVTRNFNPHLDPRIDLAALRMSYTIPSMKQASMSYFFLHSTQYGDSDFPCHFSVIVNDDYNALHRALTQGKDCLITPSMIPQLPLQGVKHIRALFIGAEKGWQFAENEARFAKQAWYARFGKTIEVVWYTTPGETSSSAYHIPSTVDIAGPQFYIDDFNIAPSALTVALANQMDFWRKKLGVGKPWWLVCQAFDRRRDAEGTVKFRTDSLIALQPLFAEMLNKHAYATGIMFFAANRPGGVRDYPELQYWHAAIYKAIPKAPPWPTVKEPTMQIPTLTITTYEPTSGEAPLRVRAVCALTDPERRIQRLEWLYRVSGTQTWILAATNAINDDDHTYVFPNPETYEIKLRGVYAGGVAETGKLRIVRVYAASQPVPTPTDPPPPLPPPSQTPGLKTAVKTASLRYWNMASDGLLTVGNDPQEFEFVPFDIARMLFAIKGPNGKYGAAEEGGGREIRFRSDDIEGWEKFYLYVHADDSLNFRAHDSNLFVCAENAGNGPVVVDRHEAKGWETFVPTTSLVFKPISTLKIKGRIHIENRLFVNTAGIFRPRFVSALTILTKNNADTETYLDWVVSTGFNGIRIFAGALPWAGLTPESARTRLPYVLQACVDRGLYCEVTALTETKTGYDKMFHVRAIGTICGTFDNTLQEIANEYTHVTQDDETHDPNYLLRFVSVLPGPVALGAGESDEPDIEQVPQAHYITLHLDRGRDKWNQVRRVREFEMASQNYGKPVLNNEPIGADELDGAVTGKQRINDPAFFFAMGALNRIFEVGGVHHSQHGLNAVLPGPVQQACADAYLRGFAAVKTNARLRFKNAGWSDSPIKGAAFDGQVVRAYSGLAEDGSDNVVVLVGLTGDPGLEMQNGWRLGNVVDEMPGVRIIQLIR
jgi:hypothetical protein